MLIKKSSISRHPFVKTIPNTKYLRTRTSAKLESAEIVSIDIIRYGATVAVALVIRELRRGV